MQTRPVVWPATGRCEYPQQYHIFIYVWFQYISYVYLAIVMSTPTISYNELMWIPKSLFDFIHIGLQVGSPPDHPTSWPDVPPSPPRSASEAGPTDQARNQAKHIEKNNSSWLTTQFCCGLLWFFRQIDECGKINGIECYKSPCWAYQMINKGSHLFMGVSDFVHFFAWDVMIWCLFSWWQLILILIPQEAGGFWRCQNPKEKHPWDIVGSSFQILFGTEPAWTSSQSIYGDVVSRPCLGWAFR